MKAVVQRVSQAAVHIDGTLSGEIGAGLLVLVCAMRGDTEQEAKTLAQKIAKLRIFKDADGKMNRSVRDINGAVLIVSQFTLAGDTSRGNRPGFSNAADPQTGKHLYNTFINAVKSENLPVQTGIFGADMQVSLINDGPVTLLYDL